MRTILSNVIGSKQYQNEQNSNSASPVTFKECQNEIQSNATGSMQTNDMPTIKPTRLPEITLPNYNGYSYKYNNTNYKTLFHLRTERRWINFLFIYPTISYVPS